MAKFDERLALTEGTNRVIEDPAGPSAVGAIVDFVNEAFTGYQNLRKDIEVKKAADKKAAEEARNAQIFAEVSAAPERAMGAVGSERAAFVQSLEPIDSSIMETVEAPELDFEPGGVFDVNEVVGPEALTSEAKTAARRAMNFKNAAEQGRVPTITFNSAMNADFRRLRDKWGPEAVPVIIKAYKEMGLDANLFTEAKDAQDEHESRREIMQKRVTEQEERDETYIKSAQEALGTQAIGKSREELIVYGMTVTKDAFDLRMDGERARNLKDRQDLSDAQRKTLEGDLDQSIEQKLITGSFNASQPFIKTMGRIVDGLGTNPSDAGLIQQFQSLASEAQLGVDRYVDSAVVAAVANGYKGDREKLRTTLKQNWQPILDLFSGDHSVVATKMNALKSIETSMKIDTTVALPLYTALSTAGFKVENIPSIMQELEKDTELMTGLANELKGYRQDLMNDGPSARFRRVISVLRGESSLAYARPGELAKELSNIWRATQGLAKDYIRKPKDIDGNLVINGIGELTTQIRTLGPSNNAETFAKATLGFAAPIHRKALIQALNDGNVDRTMAVATIHASRGASAQMLNYYRNNIPKINNSNPYFKVAWDAENGKYRLDRSGHLAALAAARKQRPSLRGAGAGLEANMSKYSRLANMAVPEEINRFIQGANINLDNVIELGKYDDTTVQGTEVQLRNWFGQERRIPSKDKAGQKIDPKAELQTMFDKAEASLDQLREDVSGRTVSLPKDITKSEGYARNAPVVREAASKHGVPEQIALALVGKESTFNEVATGPVIKSGTHKGDRAMGLGQVMAKTAAKYGVTDRASLNPAQQADLAMRVLKDNFDATGNWKDAVSMYFTGVRYDKAVKEGRSDGFNSVLEYVEDIL